MGEDFRGVPGGMRVKEKQVILERFNKFGTCRQPFYLYSATLVDRKGSETAKRGHVLVLLANWFLQNVEFDVAGLFSKLLRRHRPLGQRPQRVEQANQITAGRPQAGSRRDVC